MPIVWCFRVPGDRQFFCLEVCTCLEVDESLTFLNCVNISEKINNRIYFFPAFVPLAALLPGLLAFVGLLSAAWHTFRQRKKSLVHALLFVLVIVLMSYFVGRCFWLPRFGDRPGDRFGGRSGNKTNALEVLPAWKPGLEVQNQPLPRSALSDLAYSSKHELVVFGTRKATVDAFDVSTGQLQFSFQLSALALTRPLIDQDRLYMGEGLHEDEKADLMALSLPGGQLIWRQTFLGHIESQPGIEVGGARLVGCAGQDGVFSLDAKTGARLWQHRYGHCDSTPLILNDQVIALVGKGGKAAEARSELVFLSLTKGETQSSVALPGEPWGTPRLDLANESILVSTGVGSLGPEKLKSDRAYIHSVSVKNKRVNWTREYDSMPLLRSVGVESKNLTVHALKSGYLVALNVKTGEEVWKLSLGSLILANVSLIEASSRLIALSLAGDFFEIDSETGKVTSRARLGAGSTSGAWIEPTYALVADGLSLWRFSFTDGTHGALPILTTPGEK